MNAVFVGLARTIYMRYFWQGNHRIYGHIRCIYTVLANPMYMRAKCTCKWLKDVVVEKVVCFFACSWSPSVCRLAYAPQTLSGSFHELVPCRVGCVFRAINQLFNHVCVCVCMCLILQAMARELLMAGDHVLITSRSRSSLEAAMQDLKHECGEHSQVCACKSAGWTGHTLFPCFLCDSLLERACKLSSSLSIS
jgi:hypothetical protein